MKLFLVMFGVSLMALVVAVLVVVVLVVVVPMPLGLYSYTRLWAPSLPLWDRRLRPTV